MYKKDYLNNKKLYTANEVFVLEVYNATTKYFIYYFTHFEL